mgnify:CR=1 FL=1
MGPQGAAGRVSQGAMQCTRAPLTVPSCPHGPYLPQPMPSISASAPEFLAPSQAVQPCHRQPDCGGADAQRAVVSHTSDAARWPRGGAPPWLGFRGKDVLKLASMVVDSAAPAAAATPCIAAVCQQGASWRAPPPGQQHGQPCMPSEQPPPAPQLPTLFRPHVLAAGGGRHH